MSDFASSLPVRTEAAGDVIAKLCDATVTTQQLTIDASGRLTIKLDDGNGNIVTSQVSGSQRALDVGINVAGVQVDPRAIRALTSADVVTAAQGAPNTLANAWPVKITDGTNVGGVLVTGEQKVAVTQALPSGSNNIGTVNAWTFDGTGNSIASQNLGGSHYLDTVNPSNGVPGSATPGYAQAVAGSDGTDLRTIATDTAGQVKVNIFDSAGAAFTLGNPLPVTISAAVSGTEVLDFKTVVALAANASDTHSYTVPALTVFSAQQFSASASGKIKMEVKIASASKIVQFNSTANPNVSYPFYQPHDIPAGTLIEVIITNLDKQAQDVYSTIEGTTTP